MSKKAHSKTASKPKPTRRRPSSPLISHATILILSGYLFGIVSSEVVPAGLRAMVALAAGCGMTAYLGLRYVASHRRTLIERLENERATSKLENRIDRHVPRQLLVKSPQRFPKVANVDRQYVTVVRS